MPEESHLVLPHFHLVSCLACHLLVLANNSSPWPTTEHLVADPEMIATKRQLFPQRWQFQESSPWVFLLQSHSGKQLSLVSWISLPALICPLILGPQVEWMFSAYFSNSLTPLSDLYFRNSSYICVRSNILIINPLVSLCLQWLCFPTDTLGIFWSFC